MGIVYKATCRMTGLSYVGATVGLFRARKSLHKHEAKVGSSTYFHRAIRRYGWSSFDWQIIEEAVPREKVYEREAYWIQQLGTIRPNGYNLTAGQGFSKGHRVSPATIAKMKTAQPSKRKVRDNRTGVVYPSINEASRATGYTPMAIARSIRTGYHMTCNFSEA